MHCDLGGALARASKRVACALLLDFIDRLVCCREPSGVSQRHHMLRCIAGANREAPIDRTHQAVKRMHSCSKSSHR